jgi:hypothetical protein
MYRSWRRNILRNQLACQSAHTDLLGAFDKFSVGYFGPHPRLSQFTPYFHRVQSIAAQCAPTFTSSRAHAHVNPESGMASAGVSFLDNSAATRIWVLGSEAPEAGKVRRSAAFSLSLHLRVAKSHGLIACAAQGGRAKLRRALSPIRRRTVPPPQRGHHL